jgi:hypothetical protein
MQSDKFNMSFSEGLLKMCPAKWEMNQSKKLET